VDQDSEGFDSGPSSDHNGDYAEPSVDEAREQRDALLAQYRKEAERKRRMEGGQSGKRESGDRKSSSKSSSKHSSRAAAAEAK